jgi:nitric oxide dioxygenase
MSLTKEQAAIIKVTVDMLREHGTDITARFYKNMITEVPQLENVFNRANQSNNRQAEALADALYAYAANIDNLAALESAVVHITQKHASIFIQPEQYKIVGSFLLKAMKEVLGDAFTLKIQSAWSNAYWQLANMMIELEGQLHRQEGSWTNWRDFIITNKIQESDEVASFYLTPKDNKPLSKYHPGQYISVQLEVSSLQCLQSRQYSLSDAPNAECLRISVKRESGATVDGPPGVMSHVLHDLKRTGDVIQVSSPRGDFFLDTKDNPNSPLVLISAGIGLTPMLSILNTLVAEKSGRRISWIYAARNSRVHAFANHIRSIVESAENIHSKIFYRVLYGDEIEGIDYDYVGRMDLNKLHRSNDLFVDDDTSQYFICGPGKFMEDIKMKLTGFSVGLERIRLEIFGTGLLNT